MIKNMRHKFVWIAMLSLGVILCLNLLVIYQFMTVSNRNAAEAVLRGVTEADGRVDFKNPPMPGESRSEQPKRKYRQPEQLTRLANLKQTFAVRLSMEGNVLEVIDNGRSSFEEEEIRAMVSSILANDFVSGTVQSHWYLVADKPYGKIIAFLDCSREQDNLSHLLTICPAAGICRMAVLLGTIVWPSYWAIRPVEEGFKRQKQFVADANHGLKTPLAITSANTNVLEDLHGRSQWTESVQSDISRMSRLINGMLRLARLEQPEAELKLAPFDVSQMVSGLLLPFESMTFETEKSFSYDVEPGVLHRGNQEELCHMLSIFLENVFKYSEAGGRVACSVKKEKSKIHIEIYNIGSDILPEAREHIFERFYREENSHSREKEGYGPGLSIASRILGCHRGKVKVGSDGASYTMFRTTLRRICVSRLLQGSSDEIQSSVRMMAGKTG